MYKVTKYTIDYGYGFATFHTPYKDYERRFGTLANTCFGIRKSISRCVVISKEEIESRFFEYLRFNGDSYAWREDGARKMLEPYPDADWDTSYCDECKGDPNDLPTVAKPDTDGYQPHMLSCKCNDCVHEGVCQYQQSVIEPINKLLASIWLQEDIGPLLVTCSKYEPRNTEHWMPLKDALTIPKKPIDISSWIINDHGDLCYEWTCPTCDERCQTLLGTCIDNLSLPAKCTCGQVLDWDS